MEALVVSGVLEGLKCLPKEHQIAFQDLYESFTRHHTSFEEHHLSF
jgi:hypothetical protein